MTDICYKKCNIGTEISVMNNAVIASKLYLLKTANKSIDTN